MNGDQAKYRPPKTRPVIRALVRVDGEAYTYQQIVERTGLTMAQAQQRVRRARRQGNGVSWSHLQPIFAP